MGKKSNPKTYLMMSVFLLAMVLPAAGKTFLVDCNAPGPVYDGSSWPTAFKYLQDGLSAALSGDEIQVAEGIYKPDEDSSHPSGNGDRTATFRLKNGVTIRGGYAGFGEPNSNARDIDAYATILSGDLLGNDGPDFANNGENSYHVVTGSGTDATAVLDGFIITAGRAYDVPMPKDRGGGMYNESGNPTLTNCTFSLNVAYRGGGIYNKESNPTCTNCTFNGNVASDGAGMYNYESSPTLTNCELSGNWAVDEGGGVYNYFSTSPTLANCTFSSNSARSGGGINNRNSSNPKVINCTFSSNSANTGGGMYNNQSNPTLTNCIFSGNTAESSGGGMRNNESNPTLTNCTFIHNLASDFGGGMLNMESSPMVTNSTFNGNRAAWGGGMENESNSNLSLIGCTFKANSATMGGGAIRNHTSRPTVLNCLIVANQAQFGAGIHNENSSSNPTLINCTFSSNSAIHSGGGIFNNNSRPILNNCILWANSDNGGLDESAQIHGGLPAVNYCCIQGWTGNLGGTGNINAEPRFVEPGYWNANGVWIDGDYHLHRGSPCINAGDNSSVPLSLSNDLDGNPRIAGGTVDMGVYELWFPLILYVDRDAGGANDGSSWANAYNDLQDALADAIIGDEIRVAQGAYTPEGPLPDIRRATNPNPYDGQAGVSTTPDLSWTAGSDATSHDVYFGTSNPPTFIHNQPATTFEPGTIALGTRYYWRIDEVGAYGTITGTVWSFTTIGVGWSPPSPPPPVDRTATFQLINGVVMKGGYVGFGEPDPNERDPNIYETILSGDIAGDDGPDFANNSENSYHVVTGSYCDETAVLDGFTITGGNDDRMGPYYYPIGHGSGMLNEFGSPTVSNCTFTGNYASDTGGGMFNGTGSPTLTNCTFIGNSAGGWAGGGMFNWESSPAVTNCTFIGNSSKEWGGAICNYTASSPTLSNCVFRNNSIKEWGGAICNLEASSPMLSNCTFNGNSARNGGGMYNYKECSPTLTNCIFTGNLAVGEYGDGGGMFNNKSGPRLTNCTFAGNKADNNGRAMAGYGYAIQTLTNCILWNGGDEIYNLGGSVTMTTYSDVHGGWSGEGNIDTDPCFVDGGYWDANDVWIDGDYHLLQTSACINAANNNSLPADTQDLDGDGNTTEPIPFDLDGNPRVVYDVVDMGPYEFYNAAPIADAGPDQIVECACNTEEGTKVTLDGTNSSDPDHGVLTYTWTGPFVESPAYEATPTITLDGGCPDEYVITLVVSDGIVDSEPNEVLITVVDTTPPEFEFSVTPTMLWPPDHKMVLITPSWTVSDECDASPDVSLISITMNEGDDTVGDGHTTNDIQIGEDGSIYLRSERSGTGSDRIYTITYQAVDDCGNATIRSDAVSIPHDFKVLARIASRWLWTNRAGRIPEDLNGDGIVNLADFARFAENWIR